LHSIKKIAWREVDANPSGADEWISLTLSDLVSRFQPDDIFNADKTGLYYCALPNGSLVFKTTQATLGKTSRERLTLLVCASIAGEKCLILVIGKPKNPICFRLVKNYL